MSRTVGWLPTTPILTSLFFAIVLTVGFGFGSGFRVWLSDLVWVLSFGFVSWIRSLSFGLLVSVSRFRFLFSFSRIRSLSFGPDFWILLGLSASDSSLVFGLSESVSWIWSLLFVLFHSVSAPEFGFDSWIRF